MIKDNAVTIYGQDYSLLDDAWVSWDEIDDDGVITSQYIQFSNCRDAIKDSAISFLQALEKRIHSRDLSDVVIIGHSSDKDDIISADPQNDWHIISEYRDNLRFGSLVGTIRGCYHISDEYLDSVDESYGVNTEENTLYKFKFIVYSRFDSIDEAHIIDPKPYFLASLLLKGNLKFDSSFDVDFNYDTLFEFYMLWQLKKHLQDALFKGFYRQYQRFEKNDDKLRGSIDIARHIRMNMGMNNGRIAYSYRENTIDNAMNHLLISAYDYLVEKYPIIVDENFDDVLLGQITNLRYEIGYPKYSRNELLALNATPISHPYYGEYRALQKTCLMILRDEAISPFGDSEEEVDGILYYVPDLWEEYLEDYIKNILSDLGLYNTFSLETQMFIPIMTSVHGSENDNYDDYDEKQKNKSYPDFVFLDDGVPFCMLDAKYKAHWKDALSGKLYYRDDYDKSIRDMTSVAGTACGVVFPLNKKDIADSGLQIDHFFSELNNFGNFYTIPVFVPETEIKRNKKVSETEAFKEWSIRMEHSVNCSMRIVVKCLELEAKRKKYLDRATKIILRRLEERDFKGDGYLSQLESLGPEWNNKLIENKHIKKELEKEEQ